MLVREAKWFRDRLAEYDPDQIFPLLNVGCQSADFRKLGQPWVDRYVFAPLRSAGRKVVHTDVWQADGVDLVGDLLDSSFRQELRERGFKSAIFSNVLEHVRERERLSEAVASILPPGGLLFVSVPRRFPYHPDPIDTMYRPGLAELAALFPDTALEHGEVLSCGNLTTYLAARMLPNPLVFASHLLQGSGPAPAGEEPERSSCWQMAPWLLRSFQVSCAVLRRTYRS